MWWAVLFGSGFFLGVLAILIVEALGVYVIIDRLKRKIKRADQSILSSISDSHLDLHQSLDFVCNKQGVVWVLEPERIPKNWLDRALREQNKKKQLFEVSPVRKQARIKDETLILTAADGSHTTIKLKGCIIEAVSATSLSSRKWAKRFPIKLENKESTIYKGSNIFYIYLETSWEKECWCKGLRLASCDDKSRLDWFCRLHKEFHSYLTALNAGYPSFMKPSVGFYAIEPVDRSQKVDGPSSKVRLLWQKISKKSSKVSSSNKLASNSSSFRDGRKSIESRSCQDSVGAAGLGKAAPLVDSVKSFTQDSLSIPSSSTLSDSGSQSNLSFISDAESEEKFGIDEGTFFCNLLISRLFFDAKSNEEMKKSVQSRIQRTLSSMRTPSYIGEVICTDVNLGNLPPCILGMRVLPIDMNEVWTVEVDIEYSGGAVLVIGTRLEVRELDPEESTENKNPELSSAPDVSSNILDGFESIGKNLDLAERTIDALEHKEEGDLYPDRLKSSKSPISASTPGFGWKSIVNSVAKQVSQVPLSLGIRVTSLRGTLRLHIKPPPTDQLWFAFTSMPDIDFMLDSAVGDHKITSAHIAFFLINRLKAAINETLVLPNCESVCIPWMLAEKDDWVPRKVAPFVWINQESVGDPVTVSELPPYQPFEARTKTETNRETPSQPSENKHQKPKNAQGTEPVTESVDVEVSCSADLLSCSQSSHELTPTFLGNNESEKQKEEMPERSSPCRYLSLPDKPNVTAEEDDASTKRMGKKTRMLDLKKKMGDKLEEKRRLLEEKSRTIVEKMRGP